MGASGRVSSIAGGARAAAVAARGPAGPRPRALHAAARTQPARCATEDQWNTGNFYFPATVFKLISSSTRVRIISF